MSDSSTWFWLLLVSPFFLYAVVRLATAAYFKSKQHYESEKQS